MYFYETDRLKLKYIEFSDFWDVASMFKDRRVMYMTGEVYTDEEVHIFIEENMRRYKRFGYGYFLAVDKHISRPVGMLGLINDAIREECCLSLTYILRREFWNKGYAKEGGEAMIHYAFSDLDREKIVSLIYFNNKPAIKTAESLCMKIEGTVLKAYRGIEVPHLVYSKERDNSG